MNLNKPIEKNGIIHDGVVGDWHRWVGIMTAQYILVFYGVQAIVVTIKHYFLGGLHPFVIDPSFLVFIIPLGVLSGERAYREDAKVNGPRA